MNITGVVSTDNAPSLSVEYNSPSGTRSFEYKLPKQSREVSSAEKTQSLSDLRKAIAQSQKQINELLTQKMEEDKANAAVDGEKHQVQIDDGKEEENYGEEVE